MLKLFQIQTFTQKSDLFQTTFDLKVWIQTFAENSDQSGRPAMAFLSGWHIFISSFIHDFQNYLKGLQSPFRVKCLLLGTNLS